MSPSPALAAVTRPADGLRGALASGSVWRLVVAHVGVTALVLGLSGARAVGEPSRGPEAVGSAAVAQDDTPGSESSTAPSGSAAAKQEPAPTEVVVTGTRTKEQLQRSTLRTGVITRAEAERRGALDVAEALSGEPGLQVTPRAYTLVGSPSGVQMSGLDAERVLILRDGERVVGDAGGVVDLAQFSLAGVERIEYVVGPSSSLYGAGALGGVVNIITGAPRNTGPTGRARLEWRSLPEYAAHVDLAYRKGMFWIAPNLGVFRGDSLPLTPGRPERLYPERKRLMLGTAVGLEREGSQTIAEGRFTGSDSEGLTSRRVPLLGEYFIDLPDHTTRWEAKLRQREQFSETLQLDVSLAGQWFKGRASHDLRESPLDEHRVRSQELKSVETLLTILDGPRTWVVGVRGEHEAFRQNLERYVADGDNVASEVTAEVPNVDLLSAALFGQVGWRVAERFTLMPGLRSEIHDSVGFAAAPRLAAVYNASTDVRVRASAGRGFRVPSAKEYGFLFDHSALGYRVVGNADLKPESSWGTNADLSVTLTPQLRVQLAAFHNWVTNLIDTTFAGQETPGIDDFGYVNIGRARTFGSDASVSWLLGPRFRSQLVYSYLFTKNEESGTPLASRPHHTLLSSFSYELLTGSTLTFRGRTVSRAWVAPGVFSPAFNTSDVLFFQRFNPFLQLHAGILNALDIKEDPFQEGDQRSVTGRMYVVGLIGSYEGEPE